MNGDRDQAAAALEVVVYGARTCEDTAITRSRLHALGVRFREVDVDADADGLARVLELAGRRVTPTVVFGAGQAVVAEPTIDRLDELLRSAGHTVELPTARRVQGALAHRSIAPAPSGRPAETVSRELIRGRRRAAVFFAHDASCLACLGYAKQFAAGGGAARAMDAILIVVVRDSLEAAQTWAHELPADARVLADPGGAWTGRVAAELGTGPDGVMLLVLDHHAAPRAASIAVEAGGLMAPGDVTDWLRSLALGGSGHDRDVARPD